VKREKELVILDYSVTSFFCHIKTESVEPNDTQSMMLQLIKQSKETRKHVDKAKKKSVFGFLLNCIFCGPFNYDQKK
jgi:hypothetical protein